jgi:hypothetical protein
MHGLNKITVLFISLIFLCFLSNILEAYIERKEIKKNTVERIYNDKLKDIPPIGVHVEIEIPDSLDQSALDYKFSHEKYANIN